MTFEEALSQLTDYPTGDRAEWLARYEPIVAEIVTHNAIEEPRVSAVVVAWNAEEYLIECIDHLRNQVGVARDDVEIIVVDNGGNEPIRDAIAERADIEVRMVANAHLCRARNVGVALANAGVIAFIDDDGLVECDYFRNGLRYFDDDEFVAVRTRIVARNHPYFTTLATHYSRGARVVDDCLVTEGSSFVRTEPYIEVGGFAEDMSGHEGIDLTFRLLRHTEQRVVYVPDVVMHHDYIHTWSKFARKNWRYAGVDDRTQDRDPELAAFMDEYFSQSFDRAPMTLDEKLAREGLKFLRTAMKVGATIEGVLKPGGD